MPKFTKVVSVEVDDHGRQISKQEKCTVIANEDGVSVSHTIADNVSIYDMIDSILDVIDSSSEKAKIMKYIRDKVGNDINIGAGIPKDRFNKTTTVNDDWVWPKTEPYWMTTPTCKLDNYNVGVDGRPITNPLRIYPNGNPILGCHIGEPNF